MASTSSASRLVMSRPSCRVTVARARVSSPRSTQMSHSHGSDLPVAGYQKSRRSPRMKSASSSGRLQAVQAQPSCTQFPAAHRRNAPVEQLDHSPCQVTLADIGQLGADHVGAVQLVRQRCVPDEHFMRMVELLASRVRDVRADQRH